MIVVGYGNVSRVLRSAVDEARKQGIKAGLFCPITLSPFPSNELVATTLKTEKVLVVDASAADARDLRPGEMRFEEIGSEKPAPLHPLVFLTT